MVTVGVGKALADRYELRERIGEGGMAVVFRAYDRVLDRTVAVKVLRPELAADSDLRRMLVEEAQKMARLQHEGIITVFDAGQDGEVPFIVMELVAGENLRQLLRRVGRLSPEHAAAIVARVARAIGHAHDVGIVHCDLKPEQVLIGLDGAVKVGDFGIARRLGSQEGQDWWTPGYAAPEVRRVRASTEAADVYALGVLLTELIVGRPVGEGDPVGGIAVPELRPILRRALAADPAARYSAMNELARDLEAFVWPDAFSRADTGRATTHSRTTELMPRGIPASSRWWSAWSRQVMRPVVGASMVAGTAGWRRMRPHLLALLGAPDGIVFRSVVAAGQLVGTVSSAWWGALRRRAPWWKAQLVGRGARWRQFPSSQAEYWTVLGILLLVLALALLFEVLPTPAVLRKPGMGVPELLADAWQLFDERVMTALHRPGMTVARLVFALGVFFVTFGLRLPYRLWKCAHVGFATALLCTGIVGWAYVVGALVYLLGYASDPPVLHADVRAIAELPVRALALIYDAAGREFSPRALEAFPVFLAGASMLVGSLGLALSRRTAPSFADALPPLRWLLVMIALTSAVFVVDLAMTSSSPRPRHVVGNVLTPSQVEDGGLGATPNPPP